MTGHRLLATAHVGGKPGCHPVGCQNTHQRLEGEFFMKNSPSNPLLLISNTKVILQKPTLRNSVPEGHKETLSIYNHPPNVALFYPIAIYAHSFFWSSHQLMNYIFPLYIHILHTFTTM